MQYKGVTRTVVMYVKSLHAGVELINGIDSEPKTGEDKKLNDRRDNREIF